jgi:hypothetical protein
MNRWVRFPLLAGLMLAVPLAASLAIAHLSLMGVDEHKRTCGGPPAYICAQASGHEFSKTFDTEWTGVSSLPAGWTTNTNCCDEGYSGLYISGGGVQGSILTGYITYSGTNGLILNSDPNNYDPCGASSSQPCASGEVTTTSAPINPAATYGSYYETYINGSSGWSSTWTWDYAPTNQTTTNVEVDFHEGWNENGQYNCPSGNVGGCTTYHYFTSAAGWYAGSGVPFAFNGSWHKLGVYYKGTTATIYYDDVQIASQTIPSPYDVAGGIIHDNSWTDASNPSTSHLGDIQNTPYNPKYMIQYDRVYQ